MSQQKQTIKIKDMKKNELIYSLEGDVASVSIATLLSAKDYEFHWTSTGGTTDNVSNIMDLFEDFIVDDMVLDLQIWEKGNAFINHVDVSRMDELVRKIELFTNDKYELVVVE